MLTSYNLPTRDLLPRLAINPRVEAPPGALPLRTALVRHNTESTYVVPGDWPAVDGTAWFHDGVSPTGGSDVEYLIDGPQTFNAMLEAMETVSGPSHFIILLGWSLQHDVPLFGGKTFLQVVEERASLKVAIRVLLFDNPVHRDASGSKKALEALRTEKALDVHCQLDDHTAAILANAFLAPGSADWLPYSDEIPAYIKKKGNLTAVGAHHHKLLLVYGREGLVGFCGGIDVDENRVRWLHDVHLRATGHAAKELFRIAEQRWAHSKDNGQSPTPTSLNVPAPVMPTADPTPYLARVAQTVGNPDLRYPRVPNTLWDAVQSAVKRASRFIYIEDQYFMSVDLVRALVEASTRVAHITILVPAANVTEPAVRMHRQWAVRKLLELGGPGIEKKIGLYESTHPTHDFIHAKLFIFDDEYAIVGSANANNRGYFTDSEADVCVAEREWKAAAGARQGSWWKMEANFARRLRVSLWHEHLGLEPDELLDGVGARAHWELPPPAATVRPYHVDNLRKQRKRKQYEEWERARAEAVQNGRPFTTKEPELEESFKIWDDTRDRSPWSLAPYEEWEPERVVEDAFVDPVQ